MATITKPKKSKYTTEYITISYNTKNVNAMVLLDLLSKENGVKVSQKKEYTFDDLNASSQQAFADADAGKTIKSKNIDDLFAKLEI